MSSKQITTIDANEAVAYVAYRTNEVICIYPITPSSPLAEHADAWMASGKPNIWGTIPSVTEMQSEGGAVGAVHGSLQSGSLTTTFTSSQGLLLMIPNMFKIAGELTPAVFHVAARTVATHALSIFGDHSDVMACRSTGWAILCSNSVQESHDFALISQAASIESRIPFMNMFDGFRTSHEVMKIEMMTDDDMRALIDNKKVDEFRARGLTPDRPQLRGTAQNPDVFFQAREACNSFYNACPDIVEKVMNKFAEVVGRKYSLFEYEGAPDAERVIIMMGSGAEAAHETVEHLTSKGEKVGLVKVRLYRPFDIKRFMEVLPETVKSISVLDRTKEPGAIGEPMYLDVISAVREGMELGYGKLKSAPVIVGGRYGLSSKEVTPNMMKAVFENLSKAKPKNHFTVGINDDVTHTSLEFDSEFSIEPDDVVRAMFYGLGSDGTVGANKNSIKIIGENTDNYAQAYFVYDSKKSGAMTVSHLRFGPRPIRSTYLISKANFVGCHQWFFLEKYDMLSSLIPGGTFLMNSPYPQEEVWDKLPKKVQEDIIAKNLKVYAIDAIKVAAEAGMKDRINTVMQVCFFAVSGVLPREQAIDQIKESIRKTYGKKGEEIVRMNLEAVDKTLENLHEIKIPATATSAIEIKPAFPKEAPAFVHDVLGEIYGMRGEQLPVSAMPVDGTFPTNTAKWEKRNLAIQVPIWDPEVCIQCGKCSMICPHAAIRMKAYDPKYLENAPADFRSANVKEKEWEGMKFTIQVAPEDCTGCGICVEVCPAKNKTETRLKAINMTNQPPIREREVKNWNHFLSIPDTDRKILKTHTVKQQQLQRPLFEFSGACSGCGETPYVKLLSQLFGDRAVIANATGCSSIYGGNLPTTPWAQNDRGMGPAWCNSLFEDNAEFGLGFRLAISKQMELASELVRKLAPKIGDDLASSILNNPQKEEVEIEQQRDRVAVLKQKLSTMSEPEAKLLTPIVDQLVKKSVWILGGDGWAYDIGYGGLDHVLASGHNINVLVLDTEVYSNTGGQASKSTPRGAVAKFAAGGKPSGKKDLGLIAMSYGNIYVARVAMGARDDQTLKAFLEAEAYQGPSIIIAYSHCIAHGIDMSTGVRNQKAAVESGQWILYRFNPDLAAEGKNPLTIDSREPKIPVQDYLMMENRFKMLTKSKPEVAKALFAETEADIKKKWAYYQYLANRDFSTNGNADGEN